MCDCSSCSYTQSKQFTGVFDDGGNFIPGSAFASWPRGEPKGPRASDREYKAHVAHARLGSRARVDFGPAGIAFYGDRPGSKADAILRAAFERTPDPEPEEWEEAIAEDLQRSGSQSDAMPTLLQMAQDLRAERRGERQSKRRAA